MDEDPPRGSDPQKGTGPQRPLPMVPTQTFQSALTVSSNVCCLIVIFVVSPASKVSKISSLHQTLAARKNAGLSLSG